MKKKKKKKGTEICVEISNPTQPKREGGKGGKGGKEKEKNTRDKATDNNSKMKTALAHVISKSIMCYAESCIIKALKLVLSLVQYQLRGRAS